MISYLDKKQPYFSQSRKENQVSNYLFKEFLQLVKQPKYSHCKQSFIDCQYVPNLFNVVFKDEISEVSSNLNKDSNHFSKQSLGIGQIFVKKVNNIDQGQNCYRKNCCDNKKMEVQSNGQRTENELSKQISDEYANKVIRKKKIQKTKQIQKNKMYPFRNVISNIGNQIISFICTRKKSQRYLKLIFNQKQINQFYYYANTVRINMDNYFNVQKICQLWKDDPNHLYNQYHKIFRMLSYQYLNGNCVNSILTSKKMDKKIKPDHLIIRKKLLCKLVNPNMDTDCFN